MGTICYNLQLNEYFSPIFTQDDPLLTLLTLFFLKWPLEKILNIMQKVDIKIDFNEEVL